MAFFWEGFQKYFLIQNMNGSMSWIDVPTSENNIIRWRAPSFANMQNI